MVSMDVLKNSDYFDKMTHSDKIARGLSPNMDRNELIEYYSKRIIPFTKSEQTLINNINMDLDRIIRSKWDSASKIKVRYVKTINLENNLPHTHGNVIFVPEKILKFEYKRLLKIIVHEFVHIFQRLEPIATSEIILKMGYTPVCVRNKLTRYNIRLNPDVNNMIYRNCKGNIEIMVYNQSNPISLMDVHNVVIESNKMEIKDSNNLTEHPFEHMAYLFEDALMSNY